MILQDKIKQYYEKEIEAIRQLDHEDIERAVMTIIRAYQREATIYIFGNGGSGATASHFVCDFNKEVSGALDRKFHFVCLNDNIPTILAIANDIAYEEIFAFQLKGRLKPSDLVIAVSGSGNSVNVIRAVEYAKSTGTEVIGITGGDGGRVRELADYHMHTSEKDTQIIEDLHMSFGHMACCIMRGILEQWNADGKR